MSTPPFSFAWAAASWTPRSIVWASAGSFENGASTAIRSVPPFSCPPPQPAAASVAHSARAAMVRRRTGRPSLTTRPAEVRAPDGRIVEHGDGSAGQDATGVDDRHLVGHLADEGQVVLDQEDG